MFLPNRTEGWEGGGGSPNPTNFLFFSHTIIALLKNYIHALKQELNLYNIYPNYEKKQGPNPSRGGGGTPPLVKHKTISHYFFWKASLGEYCKFCKNIIIKCAIYSLLLHLKILHVHSLKKRSNKVTL